MSSVIDLASRRVLPAQVTEILHPAAGVRVPIDDSACIDFLIPEVRGELSAGAYSSELIRHVPSILREGDRALVIGAGLGIISSLIAKDGRCERVLAVEADPRLLPYMKRVHALNCVGWVEPINAVLAANACGRVPFYTRRDLRESSLLPSRRSPGEAALVPCMDLNLILEDEAISVIVCDIPGASMRLLVEAELGGTQRIVIDCGQPFNETPDYTKLLAVMRDKGFVARSAGRVLMFDRTDAVQDAHVASWTNAANCA